MEQKQQPEKCEPSPLGLPMRPILIRNDEMELLGASTPGPWEMDEDGCFISQEGDVLKMVGQVRGWGWLSKKYGDEKAYEIQKANGALMARAPELLQQVADLLTKVSEQEKEIHKLESLRNELISNQLGHRLEVKELDNEISEQSQRIQTLESEKGSFEGLISTLEDDRSRLREREKELVEALREIVISYGSQHPWRKESIDKAESLLSKFEVPNQS